MKREKIYEYDLDVTGVTDYGVTLEAILSGQERVPPSESVRLSTVAEDYTWVNTRQIWGSGTVNFATGKIHIDAYMQ